MKKKLKTPIYNGLKSLLQAALASSRIVSGPWGWLASYAFPKIMDKLIKPLFVKYQISKIKVKDKINGTQKAKDLINAKTTQERLDILNGKLPK